MVGGWVGGWWVGGWDRGKEGIGLLVWVVWVGWVVWVVAFLTVEDAVGGR